MPTLIGHIHFVFVCSVLCVKKEDQNVDFICQETIRLVLKLNRSPSLDYVRAASKHLLPNGRNCL